MARQAARAIGRATRRGTGERACPMMKKAGSHSVNTMPRLARGRAGRRAGQRRRGRTADASGGAEGGSHVLRRIGLGGSGASTLVVLAGEGTPSFTAYRIDAPPQVVIEFSGGRLGKASARVRWRGARRRWPASMWPSSTRKPAIRCG